MKSKSILFLITLFLVVNAVKAQPGCNEPFNPFYICLSDFERSRYFFYGEIVSVESLNSKDVVNSAGSYQKITIRIKKSFKNKLPNKIVLYIGHKLRCYNFASKNKYLFLATGGNGENYIALNASRPMADYSKKAVKEVFANVKSILNNEKQTFIEGAVYERFSPLRDISPKNEETDRLSMDLRNHQPLASILIEAVNETNGKVYQAVGKADGTFRINDIPNGTYKIKLRLPSDKELLENFPYQVDDSACSRKWYISVKSKN